MDHCRGCRQGRRKHRQKGPRFALQRAQLMRVIAPYPPIARKAIYAPVWQTQVVMTAPIRKGVPACHAFGVPGTDCFRSNRPSRCTS